MYEKYRVGNFDVFTPDNLLWVLSTKSLNMKRDIAENAKIPILIAVHQPNKVVI